MTQAASARPATRSAAKSTPKSSPAPRKQPRGYLQRSELPLTSLVFLLPFLLLYEIGTRNMSADIIAFSWFQDFFHLLGANGRHLPPLGVIGILLGLHVYRGDPWSVAPRHLAGMLLESFALAIPLILLGQVVSRYMPMAASHGNLRNMLVLSVGAGIYEELIFRLIAFALLSLVFSDLMGMKSFWSSLLMVVISSVAFSLYHYLGHEGFRWRSFAFRTLAGFYFGAVFAFRGFGISAGTHASYDVVALLLRSIP